MKKVIIVREGQWGSFKEGDYDNQIGFIKRALEDEGVNVELAKTFKGVQQSLLQKEDITAVVFISRGMFSEARQIKDNYPKLRVVVFTGLLPRPGEYPFSLDGLILIDKGKFLDRNSIREAVIGT